MTTSLKKQLENELPQHTKSYASLVDQQMRKSNESFDSATAIVGDANTWLSDASETKDRPMLKVWTKTHIYGVIYRCDKSRNMQAKVRVTSIVKPDQATKYCEKCDKEFTGPGQLCITCASGDWQATTEQEM